MPNPVLNDKVFQEAAVTEADAGWAAPGAETGTYHAPITDGPATPYRSVRTGVMTVGGTAAATGVLLVLLIVGRRRRLEPRQRRCHGQTVNFPGWILLPLFAALGVAFLTVVQAAPGPVHCARSTPSSKGSSSGPSRTCTTPSGTASSSRPSAPPSPCSPSCSPSTGCASSGSPTASAASSSAPPSASCSSTASRLLFSLFGHTPSFIYDSSVLGIGLSVLVAGIAAFNLALDFDMIERGAKAGAPEVHGVVRRLRAPRHPRLALPRDPASAGPRSVRARPLCRWTSRSSATGPARGWRPTPPTRPRDYGAILPARPGRRRAWPGSGGSSTPGFAGIHWPDRVRRAGPHARAQRGVDRGVRPRRRAAVPQHGRRRARRRIDPAVRHRRAAGRAPARRRCAADQVWCQLFSEPGAGSDLGGADAPGPSATATGSSSTARRCGARGGRYSDWGILMARTDPTPPKHQGISFFLARHATCPASRCARCGR